MKYSCLLFIEVICAQYCIVPSAASMEKKRVWSPQKRIYVINETGMPLTIMAHGILPILLSKVLPEGAVIPEECCATQQEHPLFIYNPKTNKNEFIKLLDILRKNFSYGQQISATPSQQEISFGRISLEKKRPHRHPKTKRMLQDFSDARHFWINTTTQPQQTSKPTPIEYNATYHIGFTKSGLEIAKIK